jgi:sugar phosphate isomerase/epimerase
MPIKIGFSSSVCPTWDVQQIAENANEMGFYGVELGVVRDELHLPAAEDLQTDKEIDQVRKFFADNHVEIACLASIYAFDAREKNVRMRSVTRTIECIELAEKLGCPLVRFPIGAPAGREPVEHCLARQVPHLAELARIAARKHITLLVSNTPQLPSSRSLWFVVDGVSQPGLKCAWNPVLGRACREGHSVAIPRLGARIRAIQMGDADFDEVGHFVGYRPLGEGDMDYSAHVDLLKGVLFDGYLTFDWPQARWEKAPPPDEALPAALERIVERLKHTEPELTAYKKDKKAANWSAAPTAFVERQVPQDNVGAEEAAGGDGAADADGGQDAGARVPKGGDPRIAALVAEAVKKVRAARAARQGK